MNITVSFLGVLLAAVAAMLVGMAWYSKALFFNQFVKLSGHKMDEGKKAGMGKTMAVAFVSQLVKAFVLGQMISYNGLTSVASALWLAFFIWLGFEATIELGSVLWDGKPVKLFMLNAGQELVALFAMAAVLVLV